MKILNILGIALILFGMIVGIIKFYINIEPYRSPWYDPGLSFILLGIILLIPSTIRCISNKRKIVKKDNLSQDNWCGTPQLEMEITRRIEKFGGSLAINSTDIENRLVTFLKGKTEEEWLALEDLFLISPFVLYLAEIPNEDRVKVLEDRGFIVYHGVGNTRLKEAAHRLMKEDVISLNDYLQLLSNFYKLLDNERFGKLVESVWLNDKKK